MKFRCRQVKPKTTQFVEVEADSPEAAASEYHCGDTDGVWHTVWESGEIGKGSRYQIVFAKIEVEEYGEWTVRTYKYRMWRKGGVQLRSPGHPKTLKDIAEAIGYTGDPQELVEPGWELEETMEQAR